MAVHGEVYKMDDSEIFDEVGTIVVVLSQMSLAFLGTFLNSILLVTLKDLPDICASTYHVLLANLCFSTIFSRVTSESDPHA